ncbi:Protein F26A1.8 [Aphelenchoides avenae]|nr:Protein F26A1.8 [Aphelenchus avenae]
MGAILASNFHRLTLAAFVYVLEVLSMIGFLATGPPVHLIYTGALIIFVAFAFFVALSRLGERLMASERCPLVPVIATQAATTITKTVEPAAWSLPETRPAAKG